MKKLMALTLALAFVVTATAAVAQPTMAIYIDKTLDNVDWAPSATLLSGNVSIAMYEQFSVVVVADNIVPNFFSYEFAMTDVGTAIPGMFAGAVNKTYGGAVSLGDVPGEFIVGNGFCSTLPAVELSRKSYGAFGGAPAPDTVLELTGTDPTSFGGAPGLASCDGILMPAAPGSDGGSTGSGVVFPDGGLVLNGTLDVIPTTDASFSQVKARF